MKRIQIVKKLINEGFSVKTLSNFNDRQIKLLSNIILNKNIISEASFEQLQTQFVDTGRIPEDVYIDIKKSSNGKSSYATWLISRVLDKTILIDDLYKWDNYFKIFEKYKSKFPIKDLGGLKHRRDIDDFITTANDIVDNLTKVMGPNGSSSKNLVSLNGINELKNVGIKFLGLVDGYQCFEVPKKLAGDETAYKIYRKNLAKCGNRDEGESINICTMASKSHFDDELSKGPFFVFFNTSDPKSPYQFCYESNQFMDKNDTELIK